jgi:hypothetical protein
MEDFVCKTPPKPVEQWIMQEETKEHCPPCLLQPLGDMYVGVLEEASAKEQIDSLKEAWKSKDALTIARALDRIKTEVGEPLKNKLLDLDCITQSFKQSET